MPRTSRLLAGGLATLLLAVTACDATPPTAAGSEQATTVSGLSGPGGAPLVVTDVDVRADASQAAVEVVRTLGFRDGTVAPHAVSPSGEVLVSTLAPGTFDADNLVLLATTPVALWREDGLTALGSTESLVPGDPHRQVVSATFAGEAVAWHETTGVQAGTTDWRMFHLAAGSPALLAVSEHVRPPSDTGLAGHPHLVAAGDRVGWETTVEREDGTLRTRLVSVPVAGGELREEAELVTTPAAAADGWVVLRLEDRPVGVVDEAEAPAPVGIDLVTPGGGSRPLVELDGEEVLRLAAGGGEVLAWADDETVNAATVHGDDVLRLHAVPGTHVDPWSLAVCGEHVVWAASDADGTATTYVVDPAGGHVTVLPATPDATVVCGGPYLAWTEATDDGAERVLTLARLTAAR